MIKLIVNQTSRIDLSSVNKGFVLSIHDFLPDSKTFDLSDGKPTHDYAQ